MLTAHFSLQIARVMATSTAAALCSVCTTAPWKYRCPGCQQVTCSLACVKAHKAKTGCDGRRPRTAFVGVHDYTDVNLMSGTPTRFYNTSLSGIADIGFLEDAARLTDNAQRHAPPAGKAGASVAAKLAPRFRQLHRQASNRRISLQLMPAGMSRHKSNTSFYSTREGKIRWRVEWVFPTCDVRLCVDGVQDDTSLKDCLAALFTSLEPEAPARVRLHRYIIAGADQLCVMARSPEAGPPSYVRYEQPAERTIESALANTMVVEFPVFYAVGLNELEDFTIVPERVPSASGSASSESEDDQPSDGGK
mgnify:CR=1 FL=1